MDDPYSGKPWLKHYDKHVPEKLKYYNKLYSELFRETVEKVKDRVAVYYAGAPITFAELDTMSNRFANFLREKGLKPGDVVGVNLPNVPAYYISILGILKAGCVLTGVSPLLTQRELEYQLNDSGAMALVAMDLLWGNAGAIIANTGVKLVAMVGIADFLPTDKPASPGALPSLPGINVEHFMDIVRNYPANQPELRMDPDASCLMQYTGGTTGPSKGATLTHNNMVHHVLQISTWLDTKMGSTTVLSAFPLFHQAGLALGMWSMAMGNSQVAVANPRDIAGVINLIKAHKPTILVNVPTIFIELSRQPAFKEIDFSNLDYCLSGAAPFPPENIRELESIVGRGKVVEVLGMTETSPILTGLPRYGMKKAGSAGIPLSDTDIKVVDPVTKQIVPQGESGELVARGPQVFTRGYHNKPEETANTLPRWVDLYWRYRADGRGRLFLDGR